MKLKILLDFLARSLSRLSSSYTRLFLRCGFEFSFKRELSTQCLTTCAFCFSRIDVNKTWSERKERFIWKMKFSFCSCIKNAAVWRMWNHFTNFISFTIQMSSGKCNENIFQIIPWRLTSLRYKERKEWKKKQFLRYKLHLSGARESWQLKKIHEKLFITLLAQWRHSRIVKNITGLLNGRAFEQRRTICRMGVEDEKSENFSVQNLLPFLIGPAETFSDQSSCQVDTMRQWHSKVKQRECQLYVEARFNWTLNKSRGKTLYRSLTALDKNPRHNATHCEQNAPLVKHR